MKKSIILFGGLLFLTTQSCDVLDKEPLDSISTQQYFANANAQAASSKAAAKKQADAAAAQEAQQQEIQREYAQAQTTYQNETLPAYQNQLNTLNNEMNQAQSDYNQAENSYQMAFQAWSADQSDDNENALEIAEQMRSEAQITYQNAKTAYEDYKAQR